MAEPLVELDAHPRRIKVQLRVGMAAAPEATQRLGLPTAFDTRTVGDAAALWLGPDQWLLVSDRISAADLTAHCANTLGGLPHHAVEVSAAFACASLRGARVRELLAMGSGLDWTVARFAVAQCRCTRFACIPVVAHAMTESSFELYYDRSYRFYLERWFAHAGGDPLLAKDPCAADELCSRNNR